MIQAADVMVVLGAPSSCSHHVVPVWFLVTWLDSHKKCGSCSSTQHNPTSSMMVPQPCAVRPRLVLCRLAPQPWSDQVPDVLYRIQFGKYA